MKWLSLDKAGKRYGDRWLFRNLSLSLTGTERIFLTGKSGGGKSSLLRVLCGLDHLQEGVLRLSSPITEFRAVAPYLHQHPAFLPGTVLDNLRLPFTWSVHQHKNPPDFGALLEGIGFSEKLLEQPAQRLSGGERQAVALVRALSIDPKFLFLDEPLSAMDSASGNRVRRWLTDQEVGFVWVTHVSSTQGKRWELREGALHG